MNYFRQCIMYKDTVIQTAWIPEVHARRGNKIRIKNDGEWESGWIVREIGTRDTEENVLANERDYLHQRKASDI